jgi:hypothetical protein
MFSPPNQSLKLTEPAVSFSPRDNENFKTQNSFSRTYALR